MHITGSMVRGVSSSVPQMAAAAAATKTKTSLGRPGLKNIVLVDGVRTPFLMSGTQYQKLMPHDLARQALK